MKTRLLLIGKFGLVGGGMEPNQATVAPRLQVVSFRILEEFLFQVRRRYSIRAFRDR